ncbi:putative leader peptide [Streptomyces sp. WMMB 714]|uniref:putative leader peptide n=1 Tax=Streptomyces sp. WMMB 714 TaxID=1286822 RepID=UPI0034A0CA93
MRRREVGSPGAGRSRGAAAALLRADGPRTKSALRSLSRVRGLLTLVRGVVSFDAMRRSRLTQRRAVDLRRVASALCS